MPDEKQFCVVRRNWRAKPVCHRGPMTLDEAVALMELWDSLGTGTASIEFWTEDDEQHRLNHARR